MRTCKCCQKIVSDKLFFATKRGCLDVCKECVYEGFRYDDPNTYLWIFQELDIPFIIDEWKMTQRHNSERGLNESYILGRYIAKMNLRGYQPFGWNDSDRFNISQEVE